MKTQLGASHKAFCVERCVSIFHRDSWLCSFQNGELCLGPMPIRKHDIFILPWSLRYAISRPTPSNVKHPNRTSREMPRNSVKQEGLANVCYAVGALFAKEPLSSLHGEYYLHRTMLGLCLHNLCWNRSLTDPRQSALYWTA